MQNFNDGVFTEGVSEVIIKMSMLREFKQGWVYKGVFFFFFLRSEEKVVFGRNEGRRWHQQ